ncbi:response regulator, partial [Acinetobacter baumannii]
KKMLSNQHFDLVSCDLGLIDGSGLEVMEWVVRNKKHPNQNTPFIAVTANSDSQKVQEALHRGFQEVLQKPFYENDAKRILNKYLI